MPFDVQHLASATGMEPGELQMWLDAAGVNKVVWCSACEVSWGERDKLVPCWVCGSHAHRSDTRPRT